MDIKKFVKSNPFLFVIVLLVVLTLLFLGINIYSVVITILYILFYLIFISKTLAFKFLATVSQWLILAGIVILSLLILFVVNPKSKGSSTVKTLTPAQCQPYYDLYNGDVYDITGDGIRGTMGITIDTADCTLTTGYNILLTANVSKNYEIPNSNLPEYQYAASIREPGEERSYAHGMVQLAPVLKKVLPSEVYDYGIDSVEYGWNELREGATTDTFYHGWLSTFIFYEEAITNLISRTQYDMVDTSDYVVVTPSGEYGNSYYTDEDSACESGPIIKTVQLTYTKR